MSDTRGILWILLIACAWTELGISGINAGVFRADVVSHNIGLWTDAARQQLTEDVENGR